MYNKETRKKYLEDNKEKIKQQKQQRYQSNKTEIITTVKEYQKKNKDKIRTYQKQRRQINPLYRLKVNIKNLIGNAFRNNQYKKLTKTEQILGCSYEQLKLHLESLFQPWMNWDNRGLYNGTLNYGWDIDHIIPLASAKDEFDLLRLNHYTNLQPLCCYINRHVKR